MSDLKTAMNNVSSIEAARGHEARIRAVAMNAVLEVLSLQQRGVINDNDAVLIETIFQTLKRVAPATCSPRIAEPNSSVAPASQALLTQVEALNANEP